MQGGNLPEMTNNREQRFSERFGHRAADHPITIRNAAPDDFRYAILQIARDEGGCLLPPSKLRDIICGVLRKRPDTSNYSEYPNVWDEVQSLTFMCDWFRVYEIAEAIYDYLTIQYQEAPFETTLNQCLREMGIGWQMRDGRFNFRGDDVIESILKSAQESLEEVNLPTATNELKEAIQDMSRRPEPDLSGAIHHAMAALECVAREVTGNPKSTFGDIVKRNPELVPKPLDEAIQKCWGYSSEVARHGREGRTLSLPEVQLVVGLSATLSTYLSTKLSS